MQKIRKYEGQERRKAFTEALVFESRSINYSCAKMSSENSTSPAGDIDLNGGGFLLPSLPSPPHSSMGLNYYRALPDPRPSPLTWVKGRRRLTTFIDDILLDVTRKYAKKHMEGGYHDIAAVVEDLIPVVDMLWISATRELSASHLRIHYKNLTQSCSKFGNKLPIPGCRHLQRLPGIF